MRGPVDALRESYLLLSAVFVVGAVLAGSADLSFSLPGYLWMSVNCFATSSYILLMKRATKTLSLSKFGMVFYNNLLSVPLLLLFFAFFQLSFVCCLCGSYLKVELLPPDLDQKDRLQLSVLNI